VLGGCLLGHAGSSNKQGPTAAATDHLAIRLRAAESGLGNTDDSHLLTKRFKEMRSKPGLVFTSQLDVAIHDDHVDRGKCPENRKQTRQLAPKELPRLVWQSLLHWHDLFFKRAGVCPLTKDYSGSTGSRFPINDIKAGDH